MFILKRAFPLFFAMLLCAGLFTSQPALAASKRVIDIEVGEARERFTRKSAEQRSLPVSPRACWCFRA